MKLQMLLMLVLTTALLVIGAPVSAQTEDPSPVEAPAGETEVFEPELSYDDYTVKSYSISFFGGSFSGGTYLDNKELGERTVLTDDAYVLLGYNGENLYDTFVDPRIYDAARKEIESGPAYGARIGIYISRDFHMDLSGLYATGQAVTSMLYRTDPEIDRNITERRVIDTDEGFKVFKGGIGLSYDARPAKFFGITPRLGFALGGIINRYSQLEDKTALYVEAGLGLNYPIFKNWDLAGGADITTFAFEVDELGYSNMVNYTTFTIGITWHIDVIPDQTRAAWEAEQSKKSRRH